MTPVRRRELARVLEELRAGRDGQHVLIAGSPGAGKSTLLGRVRAALATDKALRGVSVTDRPGPHYAIRDVSEVWTPGARGRQVLLIDDLDRVLERVDAWALRRALSGRDRVTVIATSRTTPGAYGDALLDFFGLVPLDELTERDALTVLGDDDARARAVAAVLGGHARALGLAATSRRLVPEGGADTDVLGALDALWPEQRARVDALAVQPQQVLDAVAQAFVPVPAAAVARSLRMEVTQVSAQLSRLGRDGLVAKVELPGTGRAGFEVADRRLALGLLAQGPGRARLAGFTAGLVLLHAPPPDRAKVSRALGAAPAHEALRSALAGELPAPLVDPVDAPTVALARAVAELLLLRGDAPLLAAFLASSPFADPLAPWLAAARARDRGERALLGEAFEVRRAARVVLARVRA